MKAQSAWILTAVVLMSLTALSCAQAPSMIGSWKVDLTFANGASHSLQFNAQDGGKGSFLLADARSKVSGPGARLMEAKWTLGEGNSVTFSGSIEFPLGNIGRDPGTLVFKGKLEGKDSITGEVDFFPADAEQSPKQGTFKAVRGGNL